MGVVTFILVALLAILTYLLNEPIRILMAESAFDKVSQSDLSFCTNVSEIKGCEDLKIHHRSNFAFIGCPEDYTLNRHWISLSYNPKDQIPFNNQSFIFSYDLENKKPKKLKVINLPKDFTFATHGIDVLEGVNEKDQLHIFSVNHHNGGQDTVEHFIHKIGSDSMNYVESFENEDFQNLNAILAVTPNSFYYTKDMTHNSGILNLLESKAMLNGGKIMFKKEKGEVIEVATGLRYANGLAFNHNKDLLYHTESYRGRVLVFERDSETNELEQKEIIQLKASPDNINVDPKSGHLYLTGMPKSLSTMTRISNFATPHYQPINSIVFRISNETEEGRFFGNNYKVESILADFSGRMSATTVAASYEDKNILLLSGTLFSDGMLDCRLPL